MFDTVRWAGRFAEAAHRAPVVLLLHRAVKLALCVRRRTRADVVAAERATDREVGVVPAVPAAGSEKAAAHRLGLSHSTVKHHLANARTKAGAETTAQLVWILTPRPPEPEGAAANDD